MSGVCSTDEKTNNTLHSSLTERHHVDVNKLDGLIEITERMNSELQ
jgi:hypothetical protein